MPTRYYFHGDRSESEPDQFYCTYCDLFVDENHFSEASHSGTDQERYDRCVNYWQALGQKDRGDFHRPSNTLNLFSSLPKPKKTKVSSFYRWLIKQKDRDDPIGDLSNDVQIDRNFPIEITSLEKIKSHLINQHACDEAIQALEEAHKEFKNNKTARSGLSLSLRFDVFRRDDYRCQICGATAVDGVCLEVDHKDPVANGGGDEMSNLWTLCFSCNRGKGSKNL